MFKIYPGFTAIAILMGPAAPIIGHQTISDYLSSPDRPHQDRMTVIQHAYDSYAEEVKLQRTVPCDEYVNFVDDCTAARTTCDICSTHEMLIRLNFPSPSIAVVLDQ
jgi:hypothetical protein